MATDWDFKIHAYLHDPPDKPFALGRGAGHEAWGRELAALLTSRGAEPGWWDHIRRADHLAAAADRSALLPSIGALVDDLRHPISGQRVDLSRFGALPTDAKDAAMGAVREEILRIEAEVPDSRGRFVRLWGGLVPALSAREGPTELGAYWAWLPADTRMPNHAVHVHQALTSAIATVLASGEEPSLLLFTVGPVQGFIAQARRTADLFAGSRLLSESLLEGVAPIVADIGPDQVLFPNLRVSAAFWHWAAQHLFGQGGALPPHVASDARFAALPNRFLALVPASRAAELGHACEERLRLWWRQQVLAASGKLDGFDAFNSFSSLAAEQVDAFLQVHWATSPWPVPAETSSDDEPARRAAWMRGGQLLPPNAALIDAGRRSRSGGGTGPRAFAPNGGALYASAFDSARRLLDATKRSRAVAARSEDGLKCSLCGERGVYPGPATFAQQRDAWRSLQNSAVGVRLRRGEALCGVCFTKRVRSRDLDWVPSTSEVAATPYKLALMQHAGDLDVADAIESLARAVRALGEPNAVVLPVLRREKGVNGPKGVLARIQGEFLLPSPRDLVEATDVQRRTELAAVERAAARLRRVAQQRGVRPPRPYLAVLAFDGDEMGLWLSGQHNRTLADYVSARAATMLRESGAGEYLAKTWPLTPALHASLSEACGNFSQHIAPRVAHDLGLPAFLVYAGGDDALALTAVGVFDGLECATELALQLRLRYSGHVRRHEGGDVGDERTAAGFTLSREGPLLAFGHRATASVGIAVFHHRWPLGRALAEARAALDHDAKEHGGRNALAIRILRRSGQITHATLPFEVGRGDAGGESVLRSFQALCTAFAEGWLSPRFVSEVSARLAAFQEQLQRDEFDQLVGPLVLQAARSHLDGAVSGSVRDRVIASVEDVMKRGVGPGSRHESALSEAPVRVANIVSLVEAAAFMAREGEE